MHLTEEEFIKASRAFPGEATTGSRVPPTGQVAMGLAYMDSMKARPVQPDLCPTREHLDQLEKKGEKLEKEIRVFHAELREAHREYTRAADRAGKMMKRFKVDS